MSLIGILTRKGWWNYLAFKLGPNSVPFKEGQVVETSGIGQGPTEKAGD